MNPFRLCAPLLYRCAAFAWPEDALTFHAAPKPLHPNAVVSGWESFLGSAHNAISPETHTPLDWPHNGSTLVWDRATETGDLLWRKQAPVQSALL